MGCQIHPSKGNWLLGYNVKEIFFTLQGEGIHSGRPAVFCRFTGCNLWSGREEDRKSAVCQFCDTDFRGTDGPGGGRFGTEDDLAKAIGDCWGERSHKGRFVVFTGGEPLLQLDAEAISAVRKRGFEVAVETNGTLEVPPGVDHVCVSPKAGSNLVVTKGDELKLVYPQVLLAPSQFENLDFKLFYLQPMDGPNQTRNIEQAASYCLAHPKWRLGLQIHKLIGLP